MFQTAGRKQLHFGMMQPAVRKTHQWRIEWAVGGTGRLPRPVVHLSRVSPSCSNGVSLVSERRTRNTTPVWSMMVVTAMTQRHPRIHLGSSRDTPALTMPPAGRPASRGNKSLAVCVQLEQCPRGTYREDEKGRGVDDCALCPVNTYQNTTGATADTDCIRCPDGFFAEEEGTAECNCMTEDSCLPEWQNFQRDSMPYIGRK